ncbi:MAG: dienelactone hydrolase family protein [Rhodospirillaceae bacterium]|jgi:carboxymethylenebutenolidase|nr:dienelactone hydrolase family protein [Rhodospirillaceae bacterium]MBT4487218.1 dienelactone hydrolase family protein [Rhodospirillaceae bacterium]MBT5192779.1 dienelactone hydrolase family protein [Rhodospirillaceae bacterium]MBT5895400.1 dienelactone hydrolase family protein [Rhodospirillaceae bacterium]MBT6428928.1 dienelactone hydrolase family protein [Rhodospirillaceae bacterium]
MGTNLTLTAEDGHSFGAYRADPAGAPRGGIIVIQEIFGVNIHIRETCDRFASEGYVAIAPALFDRSETKNCELGYTPDDIAAGRDIMGTFSWDLCIMDMKAAYDVMAGEGLKVGSVGYCWGGTMSYLAGTRLPVSAAVVYYGGQIMPYVDEKEGCPLLMHFGEHDQGIPLDTVDAIDKAHPDAVVHIYDADHGFNCDHRGSYSEAAANQARDRTMELFAQQLG